MLSAKKTEQEISVQLLWHDKELDCESTFMSEDIEKVWFIEQFMFFLSNVEITTDNLNWQRLKLMKTQYQNADTVLLGINCQERKQQLNATALGNWLIGFDNDINLSKLTAVRFTLGVPFASNHLNPISQDSPLNLPSMFWVWQTGHKFMRAEFSSLNEQWLFHLGSTGCKSSSVMRGPKSPCLYPNSVNFELPVVEGEGKQLVLNVNLAQLLKKVVLTQASSCQSEQDSASCQQLFSNLFVDEESTEKLAIDSVFNAVKVKNLSKGAEVE
ncbi:MbnP family copper-binding protein [Cognaticolwellia mytili]|uniref:MbnP family copper-binding protein n=1 Tax=Cognaticolwellia mytili TaxID=1888913 RepID=UPI001301A6AE|nr:MbnP family copper-binding protein [Cognaticolwellia mytili]